MKHFASFCSIMLLTHLIVTSPLLSELTAQHNTAPAIAGHDVNDVQRITAALKMDSISRYDTIHTWNKNTFEEAVTVRRTKESLLDHCVHCLGISEISLLLTDHSVLVTNHTGRNSAFISWNSGEGRIDTMRVLSHSTEKPLKFKVSPHPDK